jgi:hypothetical protein
VADACGFFINMSAMSVRFVGAGEGLLEKSCFARAVLLVGARGGWLAAEAFLASTALPNIGRGWKAGLNPTACTFARATWQIVFLSRGRTARRRTRLEIPVMRSRGREGELSACFDAGGLPWESNLDGTIGRVTTMGKTRLRSSPNAGSLCASVAKILYFCKGVYPDIVLTLTLL